MGSSSCFCGSRPSAFGDDRARVGPRARRDLRAARRTGTGARLCRLRPASPLRRGFGDVPEDAPLHAYLGLALAYLGRSAEAIREGERGVELLPISRNAVHGADLQRQLALTHLIVGEPEQALDRLEPLLKIPYYLSPGWLKIDPNFAPLRGNPRFERLVNGTVGATPRHAVGLGLG